MEPIEEQVRTAVAAVAGISTLLVFGSRARGASRLGSDLDVAVLPSGEDDSQNEHLRRHRLQKDLAVALSDLAPDGRVDVVFLDEASVTLR